MLNGLHGLDTEADWIQSTYHGWVYGYKAHVRISVAATTVCVVLDATVTGSACEGHILQARVRHLPPVVDTLWLDAGYDDADLIADCAQHGMRVIAPLSKLVGVSTCLERRNRAAYLAAPEGKARYQPRRCSIEPFFATLKSWFQLEPLPVQGKTKASVFILLALCAWNLIVLFNSINHHPVAAVKSVLDLL